jgi:hypothetical protein
VLPLVGIYLHSDVPTVLNCFVMFCRFRAKISDAVIESLCSSNKIVAIHELVKVILPFEVLVFSVTQCHSTQFNIMCELLQVKVYFDLFQLSVQYCSDIFRFFHPWVMYGVIWSHLVNFCHCQIDKAYTKSFSADLPASSLALSCQPSSCTFHTDRWQAIDST